MSETVKSQEQECPVCGAKHVVEIAMSDFGPANRDKVDVKCQAPNCGAIMSRPRALDATPRLKS